MAITFCMAMSLIAPVSSSLGTGSLGGGLVPPPYLCSGIYLHTMLMCLHILGVVMSNGLTHKGKWVLGQAHLYGTRKKERRVEGEV